MKTADAFSAVRIFFAPVFFFLYFFSTWTGIGNRLSAVLLLPLLILAEFTDFLDGFYARKYNEVSDFGKLFDPFADVFLHMTTFFCYAFSGHMPLWTLVLITHRELGMLFVRLIAVKHGVTIGAKMGGFIYHCGNGFACVGKRFPVGNCRKTAHARDSFCGNCTIYTMCSVCLRFIYGLCDFF